MLGAWEALREETGTDLVVTERARARLTSPEFIAGLHGAQKAAAVSYALGGRS